MTPQEQLDEWCDQYDLDKSKVLFRGYDYCGERMGYTDLYSDGRARITLNQRLDESECAS